LVAQQVAIAKEQKCEAKG